MGIGASVSVGHGGNSGVVVSASGRMVLVVPSPLCFLVAGGFAGLVGPAGTGEDVSGVLVAYAAVGPNVGQGGSVPGGHGGNSGVGGSANGRMVMVVPLPV